MFAHKIERWSGKQTASTEPNTVRIPPLTLTNTLIGNETIKRVRFLDNGEGKILTATNTPSREETTSDNKSNKGQSCKINARECRPEHMLHHPQNKGEIMLMVHAKSPCNVWGAPTHLACISDTPTEDIIAHAQMAPTTMLAGTDGETDGLLPPRLATIHAPVTGLDKGILRKQNKARHRNAQATQPEQTFWTTTNGEFYLPPDLPLTIEHRNRMCPGGLARLHPAGDML